VSLASYTLALWIKVLDYPATKAGIVGPLSIVSDGKLDFSFQYSRIVSYKQPTFPKQQWVSIIVAYTFKKSRFSLFVDDVLDSVVYTSPGNSSQFATLSMYGFVGASQDNAGEGITVLNVGGITFFQRHVHDVVALALAHKLNSAGAPHKRVRKRFVPLVVPFFLAIIWAALNIAVVMATVPVISPMSGPSLQVVVDRIVGKVGKPANQGQQVSRQDIGIDENYPIHIDVGGEGPLMHDGLVTGFEDAVNLNAVNHVTVVANAQSRSWFKLGSGVAIQSTPLWTILQTNSL
jgi:hypothetical protein